jgi:hypothetical protein
MKPYGISAHSGGLVHWYDFQQVPHRRDSSYAGIQGGRADRLWRMCDGDSENLDIASCGPLSVDFSNVTCIGCVVHTLLGKSFD